MYRIKIIGVIVISVSTLLYFCSNRVPQTQQKTNQIIPVIENPTHDSIQLLQDEFSVGELKIISSPSNQNHLTFSNSEKVIDYDISPIGINVASIIQGSDGIYSIKFWQIDKNEIVESYNLPKGIVAKAITWHPLANAIFVLGTKDSKYQIFRIEKRNGNWRCRSIYSSTSILRRLVISPRPFATNYDEKNKGELFAYRLFFGMDNGDNTYRIVSITENGSRFYQVIGPSKTFSKASEFDAGVDPSTMEATWALPIAFHPAGHQLIWQDKNNNFFVAKYYTTSWGESSPLNISISKSGTITPTPNGLGLIHWQKDKPGIGVYLLSTKKEETQIDNYKFTSTPSSVPDGKGIVGLTIDSSCYTLNYVPINVPLSDVVNAWMFAESKQEIDLFKNNFGLFRPNKYDQIYKLYESENYYCNSYDRTSPTRPYLVTTDIFWESFGAAYQGIFIIKEREQAIPNFWKFIDEAYSYLSSTNQKSPWLPVIRAIKDLRTGKSSNPEVQRILKEKDCLTELTNRIYSYSNLKPRGHYNSSPEMENYFRAFRYFTTIYSNNQDTIKELNQFPNEIASLAEKWIEGYSGLISPSRAPMVWYNIKKAVPSYCQYPEKELTVFPLSWGFDNEIFNSTIYHDYVPSDLQVKGPLGLRLLPSGLDLASAMGNSFAEKLLEEDYAKYPPLRKVIKKLKKNFKDFSTKPDVKENLYNQWIDAIAVQWSDSVNSTNGSIDKNIWQTKRLQTGFATWATLRHATILVNERTAAECGEAGFEALLMRVPRGYVEPDPFTFSKIAELFEGAAKYISITNTSITSESKSLFEGINKRLKEAAKEARVFQAMAEKERRGEMLNNEENEKILYVARTAEHLFLIFNSLSNSEYALSNPDPISKIADVSGDGVNSPYLMAAVGNTMEWDFIVPFYGRHQIVKGSIYSYYEFKSNKLINDKEWREEVTKKEFLPWIAPYITEQSASGMSSTLY